MADPDRDEDDALHVPLLALETTTLESEGCGDAEDEETLDTTRPTEGSGDAAAAERDDPGSTVASRWCRRVLRAQILLDRVPSIGGGDCGACCGAFESEAAVKLAKFVALTCVSIAVVHAVVADPATGLDDRDRGLDWRRMWTYDANLVLLDAVAFFVVGRLWRDSRRGVDRLEFVLPMALCNAYFECQKYVPFLQHSATRREMYCDWPVSLWVFVLAVLAPTVCGAVLLHVARARRNGEVLSRSIELAVCALFFVQPVWSSPNAHAHHWFAGWFLGMHCNHDVWWSRLAMAWCWGMYVNGIAVYGRAPVLDCQYARFLMEDDRCSSFLGHAEEATTTWLGTTPDDWRNCDAR